MPADLHAAASARLARVDGRYTRQRQGLVELLAGAGQPLTAEEILARAGGVPQSSLYRNLAVLEETGVVHRLAGESGMARFELAEELTGHHHHLVCSSCGAMTDVELPTALETTLGHALDEISRAQRFSIRGHRLDVVGVCASCG